MENRIKEERNRLNLSQKELSSMIGIAQSTLNNYETCHRSIPSDTLYRLADIFGCTTDYLLLRTNNKKARTVQDVFNGDIVCVEVEQDYYDKLTALDVKKLIHNLYVAGFDISKISNDYKNKL